MNTLNKIIFSLGLIIFSIITLKGQPIEEKQKIFASDPVVNGQFGDNVNVCGDYAISGAHGDNNGTGAVYVFYNNSGVWEQIAKLTPSDGGESEYFGTKNSIYGDYIIVGVKDKDDYGWNSGKVYVFEKPVAGWTDMTETAQLISSDIDELDYFGCSVDINENYAIVGAYYQDNGGNPDDDFGAVYVFEKPAGGWENMSETAKLTTSDGTIEDYFGCDVSISGEYFLAGCKGDDDQANYSGSAYIFYNNAGNWEQQAKLQIADGEASDGFGFTVDLCGDVAIVSAYWKNISGVGSGAAYIFEKPATGWENMTETAQLTPSDGVAYDYFSCAISINDNYAVAGAHYSPGGGVAYFFEKPVDGWEDMTETAKLTASDGTEYFAHSVALTDNNVFIGAYGDDDMGSYSGAAYIFGESGPGLVNHPVDVEACINEEINFSVNGNFITSYQWQESIDGGSTYSDITDNSIYTGTTTETLTILVDETLNNNQYRCFVTFDDGTTSGDEYSDAATLTLDAENPTIVCSDNQEVTADINNTYTVSGSEFDPVSIDDNCMVESVENDYNNQNTLDGEVFPLGTTTVIWTVTDEMENEAECSFEIFVNEYVGISKINDLYVEIYPNPNNGIFELYLNQRLLKNHQQIVITDITGKVILNSDITSKLMQIDMSMFNKGVYFIKINTESGNFVQKIIIQ